MRRRFILVLAVVLCLVVSVYAGVYSGGNGTEEEPYLIGGTDDIIEMSNTPEDWEKHFLMTADVDMINCIFTTAVIAPDINTDSGLQGTPFSGVFDGNGFAISNLTIDTFSDSNVGNDDNGYLGLFGTIYGEQAEVKNLGLANILISGGGSSVSGGLCGSSGNSTINNCYVSGSVIIEEGDAASSYFVGGLSGANNGTISNCRSTASVAGPGESESYGGLCGVNGGTIIDCWADCSVSGGYHSHYLGALCGWNRNGKISKCYSTGTVTGEDYSYSLGGLSGQNGLAFRSWGMITSSYCEVSVSGGVYSRWLGGFCGGNDGFVSDCYATGSVSGGDFCLILGGLCAGLHNGKIINSYSSCSVAGGESSEALGGLCGALLGTSAITNSINNSYWDIETSGMTTSAGGTGLTTEEMMQEVSFVSWDFLGEDINGTEDIWKIAEGFDYPRLWWELYPLEVAMKWTPEMLNCESKGKWVKAHLTLPEGFVVEDVDAETAIVLSGYGLESVYVDVILNDEEKVDVKAAFDREEFCSTVEDFEEDLTVIGFFADGNIFYGADVIEVWQERSDL